MPTTDLTTFLQMTATVALTFTGLYLLIVGSLTPALVDKIKLAAALRGSAATIGLTGRTASVLVVAARVANSPIQFFCFVLAAAMNERLLDCVPFLRLLRVIVAEVDKFRALATKYKILRKKQDSYYDSRLVKTLLNSYIKRGTRGTANRFLFLAISKFRQQTCHDESLGWTLFWLFQQLKRPLVLARKRFGAKYEYFPALTTSSFKPEELGVQGLYKSTRKVEGLLLDERVSTALVDIFTNPGRATVHRDATAYKDEIVEQRVNFVEDLRSLGETWLPKRVVRDIPAEKAARRKRSVVRALRGAFPRPPRKMKSSSPRAA